MSLRIVTDSTSDIPVELAKEHGITVVPLTLVFGDEQFADGIDITHDEFFRRLAEGSTLPTTSQPSPGTFRQVYERLRDSGATEILSIHVSGGLSRTIESARQGATDVSGVRIQHIDSGLISLSLGLGVLAAAQAAERGADLDRAAGVATEQFHRTTTIIVVDTLEYLRRGGRIGRARELLGSLLSLKPLLGIEGGEIVPLARARTRKRALALALERVEALLPAAAIGLVDATTPGDLLEVQAAIRLAAPSVPLFTSRVTPVIGAHAGPGMLLFAVVGV